jgi:hypothetical protein
MAWGSDTAAIQLSSITTEQFSDQVPTLDPRETAHVKVSVDCPGLPDRPRDRRGAPVARRSVPLPAPMERGAHAHGERAAHDAALDRHRRGRLPDGVTSLTASMSGCRRAAGMIDWIRTVQSIAAIGAVILATVVSWWKPGLPRLMFSAKQMSDTQPIDLNSAASWHQPACERHRRSLERPYRPVLASRMSSDPRAGSRPPGTT